MMDQPAPPDNSGLGPQAAAAAAEKLFPVWRCSATRSHASVRAAGHSTFYVRGSVQHTPLCGMPGSQDETVRRLQEQVALLLNMIVELQNRLAAALVPEELKQKRLLEQSEQPFFQVASGLE